MLRGFLSSVLGSVLIVALLAGASRADEDPREAAATHYARGMELATQGLYEAALEQFNDAYAASPHFAVLYNIGEAQMALGRPLEAIEALTKYLRDGADQVPLSRREQVQAQIGLLESRLAELTINANRQGAVVRVDGRDVGRTPLFQPIRLAAGAHTVTAALPNGEQITRDVPLKESERQTVQLTFTSPLRAPRAPVTFEEERGGATDSEPLLSSVPAGPPPEPWYYRGKTMRRIAYAAAGVGVLCGGAALGLYLADRGKYDDWRAGNAALAAETKGSAAYRVQATSDNTLAESLTTANHAILGLSIAGGVLIGAGATLFLVDRAHRHPAGELSFGVGQLVRERRLDMDVVKRTILTVALLPALLTGAGCFNVQGVDPGPYVIDDFDNGSVYPLDPNFGGWQCYAYNPNTNMNYSCALSPDTLAGSGYSLGLTFTIDDPLDGTQEHGGAGLETTAVVPEDFTRFSEIFFAAKLQSGKPALPSNAYLYLELSCSTAQLEDGSAPGNIYLLQGVQYTSDWSTFNPPMTNFAIPPWEAWEIKGGTQGCLERVDAIQFVVDAQIPDGQSGAGILNVDDIYFQ